MFHTQESLKYEIKHSAVPPIFNRRDAEEAELGLEQPLREFGFEEVIRIELDLPLPECRDGICEVCFCIFGPQRSIFCKVESSACFKNYVVHFMTELPESIAVFFSHIEIKRKRVTIDCMRKQKFVGAVTLENCEIGNKPCFLTKFELLAIHCFGMFFRDERLVLD